MTTKKNDAVKFLDRLIGDSASFGGTLQAIRLSEEMTQAEMAKKLGITNTHLSQLERCHKFVSPERALTFAKKLGYPPKMFISLSLQDQLQRAGIKFKVFLEAA
ncbi:helix-turn-helix domain-containing protein [Bdellovibrio bacteriovorus]|uniref:helix-turn-helix domain-containing protein n=1 Tax=Bdellovibrio bacteriovorus TaxID=959 RepID=UPI0035A72A5E